MNVAENWTVFFRISIVMLLFSIYGQSAAVAPVANQETGHQPSPSASISPDPALIEACKPLLLQASQETERIAQIRKILNDNLHWMGDRHTFFPARNANWSDMQAALALMKTSDIPILVYLIGTGKLKSGMKGIALGVLIQLGTQARPCILAGIDIYQTQRASDLMAIRP